MANSGGGWIICGIEEENSAAADIIGVNLDVTDAYRLMATPPDWADGLPLDADGYECSYYRKD